MTTLRKRLAQMGEVARNAAEPTFGGRWTCSRERHDGTAHVYSPSSGPLRQATPVAETNPIFGAHIATFSPDVAAALVAVADALRNAYDVGAVAEWIDVEGDGPKAALDALAAVLGVSAPPSRDGAVHTEKTEPGAVGEAAPSEARSAR